MNFTKRSLETNKKDRKRLKKESYMNKSILLTIIFSLFLGCGQKGPLNLPENSNFKEEVSIGSH